MKADRARKAGQPMMSVGDVFDLQSGAHTITKIDAGRIYFRLHNAAGQRIDSSLPLEVFQQMTHSIQSRRSVAHCVSAWPRRLFWVVAIYAAGCAILYWRGLYFWWYWPLHFEWEALLNALSDT